MRMRNAARTACLVAVAIVAVACGGGGASAPSGSPAGSSSFDAASVQAAVDDLASIGVDVRTLPSDEGPASPIQGDPSTIRFLRFQVRNMALEVAAGAGTTGKALDDATVAADAGPVTPLLVGWIRSAGTPASELARKALGNQNLDDPKAVVFPTIVMAAFLADATRGGTTNGGSVAVIAPAFLEMSSADLCSQVSSYLDQTLQGVVDPQAQFDVPWLKAVVDQYAPSYQGQTDLFRKTVGALALLAYATSVARSWTIHANPAPSQVAYSIEGEEPVEGEVLVSVDPGSGAFAKEVQPCASLAQIQLKGSPLDKAPVYWDVSGLAPHAKATEADSELDVNQASLKYATTAESKDAADNGEAQTAEMSVTVIVDREEMRSLATKVGAILLGPALSGPAGALVKSLYAKMQPALGAMMFPSAVATIGVTFHTPPTPSPSAQADVLTGTWEGGYTLNGMSEWGFTLVLTQVGDKVTGTGEVTGPTCVRHQDITGTVSGRHVHLIEHGDRDVILDGKVEGDSMSGTWTAISCGPPYSSPNTPIDGTWEAKRG